MNEKTDILENESEVLRGEFCHIGLIVQRHNSELGDAFKRRDNVKMEMRQAEVSSQPPQSKIDFQARETEPMNHILQTIQQRINHQQERDSAQADDCADRQRMLIDKQDELCIVYEQLNRHENVMRAGEVMLRERDERVKLLNLELRGFARRIDITRRKIPQLRSYDEEIGSLDRQFARDPRYVDDVTRRLEVANLKEHARVPRPGLHNAGA